MQHFLERMDYRNALLDLLIELAVSQSALIPSSMSYWNEKIGTVHRVKTNRSLREVIINLTFRNFNQQSYGW